ncbi:MAG: LysR family hydrogen peroxide-inducible transcriptional activator [Candidatus Azotimanducaceae bacterium]|jgi:LysR family hydrogen peroxide-inducible transcriptional activator
MRLPPIRQLQYLVALREHLHFGRAAGELNVTQSTLSTGLRELENNLGITLVERTNKSVAFTPAGEKIADRARYIIMQCDDLIAEARAFTDPLAIPVKLGAIPTIAPYLMGNLALRVRDEISGLPLYIREDTTANLIAELLENRLDLALLALPYDVGRVETRTIYREGFHLAFSESSVIVDSEISDFDALPDESLLLLDDGHCLRDHALAGCRLKNHKKIHTFGANSLQMLIQMVSNDLGVTLIPDMALSLLEGTNIKTTPLPRDRFYRDIGFAWRKGHSREALLEDLMTLLEIPEQK